MKKYSREFPVAKMAKVFQVSRAGYYKFLKMKPSQRAKKSIDLACKIKSIFNTSRGNYGSPRIHAVLKKDGEFCSRKRVAKIMKQNQLYAKAKRKWKATSYTSKNISNIVPNLLGQNFKVSEPNKVWALDITYIETGEGWLYVSVIEDLFSRRIVGLSMGDRMDTELVLRSLRQALCRRIPLAGLILHSDRGSQYTSNAYKKFAQEKEFLLSMSAKGNCYDNAAVESFFHTVKLPAASCGASYSSNKLICPDLTAC